MKRVLAIVLALCLLMGMSSFALAEVPKPKKVVLDQEKTVKLNIDETLQLNATLQPEGAESTLKWSSSSKKIATVKDGLVTPVKEGTATITVKTANGKKDTVKVKVVDPYKPTKVVLDQSKTVTLEMGKTLQLNATLQPETAKTTLKWSTSSKKIATVKDGLVTPVKEGTATITVKTANGKKDTVKVKVVDPYKPTKVVLDQSKTVTLEMGKTLQLNAALQPETAKTTLKWSTSSKKIATVDENGVVTPVKKGTATITVKTVNGKKDSVKVKVIAAQVTKPEETIKPVEPAKRIDLSDYIGRSFDELNAIVGNLFSYEGEEYYFYKTDSNEFFVEGGRVTEVDVHIWPVGTVNWIGISGECDIYSIAGFYSGMSHEEARAEAQVKVSQNGWKISEDKAKELVIRKQTNEGDFEHVIVVYFDSNDTIEDYSYTVDYYGY